MNGVPKVTQVESAGGENMSPLKNHNSLWDSVRDIQHQHSGIDNRVESLRAGDVEQAVDDAESC